MLSTSLHHVSSKFHTYWLISLPIFQSATVRVNMLIYKSGSWHPLLDLLEPPDPCLNWKKEPKNPRNSPLPFSNAYVPDHVVHMHTYTPFLPTYLSKFDVSSLSRISVSWSATHSSAATYNTINYLCSNRYSTAGCLIASSKGSGLPCNLRS